MIKIISSIYIREPNFNLISPSALYSTCKESPTSRPKMIKLFPVFCDCHLGLNCDKQQVNIKVTSAYPKSLTTHPCLTCENALLQMVGVVETALEQDETGNGTGLVIYVILCVITEKTLSY